MTRLVAVQSWILAHGGRLSGSRANGTHSEDSDWDYYLPHRHIRPFIRFLVAQDLAWDSPVTGAVTCWPDGIQVEVSDLFPRTRKTR